MRGVVHVAAVPSARVVSRFKFQATQLQLLVPLCYVRVYVRSCIVSINAFSWKGRAVGLRVALTPLPLPHTGCLKPRSRFDTRCTLSTRTVYFHPCALSQAYGTSYTSLLAGSSAGVGYMTDRYVISRK